MASQQTDVPAAPVDTTRFRDLIAGNSGATPELQFQPKRPAAWPPMQPIVASVTVAFGRRA
jgi:hypothetical protein